MRSFVLSAIVLLAAAAVASAGVDVGLSLSPGTMGGAITVNPGDALTLYMNFAVGAETAAGARSVEGRVGASAPGVLDIVTDWYTPTYPWSAYYNTLANGWVPYLTSHYNEESVDGAFTAGRMWDTAFWLDLNNVQGVVADPGPCQELYATSARIGGSAGAATRAKGGPGGAFIAADGIMTLAILEIVVPGDAPGGPHCLSICDANYTDNDDGLNKAATPVDLFQLYVVPEPTAALLLIGLLPFLRRRR